MQEDFPSTIAVILAIKNEPEEGERTWGGGKALYGTRRRSSTGGRQGPQWQASSLLLSCPLVSGICVFDTFSLQTVSSVLSQSSQLLNV